MNMVNLSMVNVNESETSKMLNHITEIADIGKMPNMIGNIFLAINIILCILTIKHVKNNKFLLIISIVFAVITRSICGTFETFGFGYSDLGDAVNNWKDIENTAKFHVGLCIMYLIVQFIIFIKLIINIVKNRKKEEP